jgi:hypothetical protein
MKKKKEVLSDFYWTLLWMAIRYAMNRQTISSVTLPKDIIRNCYYQLSTHQKEQIVKELRKNDEGYKSLGFGNENVERPTWLKFMNALNEPSHYECLLIDGSKEIVFESEGRIYSLSKYLENPFVEIYIPQENIKQRL